MAAMRIAIYGLIDPRTGGVRYVGKANSPEQRLRSHIRDARRRNSPVHCWIRKLAENGQRPAITVLEWADGDWRAAERRLIAQFRAAGPMLNVANGGDEPYCPPGVRVASAKRMNTARRDPITHGNRNVLRCLGQQVSYLRKIGRVEDANRMSFALDRLKRMAVVQPEFLFFQFASKPLLRRNLGISKEILQA